MAVGPQRSVLGLCITSSSVSWDDPASLALLKIQVMLNVKILPSFVVVSENIHSPTDLSHTLCCLSVSVVRNFTAC